MRILWISPDGAGALIAERIRDHGHNLVVYGEGAGLPLIQEKGALYTFAKASDLVVVDGPFPLQRTRRSFYPSQDSLFFEELRRKHDIRALGPTPTIDLLVGDARYFKKWCRKLGIPHAPALPGDVLPWSAGTWFCGPEVVAPGPYLLAWHPLFKSVGFRGWFELQGHETPEGIVVSRCSARWPAEHIPQDREAEFLKEMQNAR